MNCKAPCFAALSSLFLSTVAVADSITLNPIQWNTLYQSTSASNQMANGLGDIFVGRTNQSANVSTRRGLVEFDIADNLPANATITSGSLTMCNVSANNGSQIISLFDVLQGWGQGSGTATGTGAPPTNSDATWLYTFYNASNPPASPTWNVAGGTFSMTLSGSAVDNAVSGGSVSWSSPQMATDIQNWLANPSTNFGWLIQGNESVGQTAKQFETRSVNDPMLAGGFIPRLDIQYTVPVPEPASVFLAAAGLALAGACGTVRGTRRYSFRCTPDDAQFRSCPGEQVDTLPISPPARG